MPKYHIIKEMHSRDNNIAILIVLAVYMIVHYSSLFQYFFYWSTIIHTLVEKSKFFGILVAN